MASNEHFKSLLKCVRDVKRWLKAAKADGVVIGAVAVGALGTPRATRDVDVLVVIEDYLWSEFVERGKLRGFTPRIADALQFAEGHRVLLMQHDPSGVSVDVSLGALDFEREVLSRAISVVVDRTRIPVPTPEDLIIMKMVARRPRDIRDVEGLLEQHPRLDIARIRRYVEEFADVLESPDMVEDLERLLRSYSQAPKRKKR